MPSKVKFVSSFSPASSPRIALPYKSQPSLLTLAVLTASLQASHAFAAESPTAKTLPLPETVISATRQEQSADQVAATISAKDRAALDRDNVNSIRDLVRHEPGVSVSGAGQRSGTTGYNIRGIDGDRILTQIDGVEIPGNFANGPYAQARRNYVDPEIIKRVEILRGPASALYGSSAIGGAVSYFTLDPDDIIKEGKDVGARFKVGYSSADEGWLKSATLAGRERQLDGLLHFSQRDGIETRSYGNDDVLGLGRSKANPEDATSINVLTKLGWNYGEDARLGLTYEKYRDDRDTVQLSAIGGPFVGGRPMNGYLWRDGNDTVTRERFGLEHRFALNSALVDNVRWSLNHQTAKTVQNTYELLHVASRPAGGMRPTGKAGGAHGQGMRPSGSHGASASARGGSGRQAPPMPLPRLVDRERDTLYKEQQWVLDLQLDKAFSVAQTDHVLTYGTTLKQQKVTGRRSGSATCAAVYGSCREIGDDSPADRLKPSSDFPDPTVRNYGLFVQDQIRWDDWTWTPALRYDYTRMNPRVTPQYLNAIGLTDPAKVDDQRRNWHRLTPRLSVTHELNDRFTWYGQYAEGFRTPTAKALYGKFENLGTGYVVEPNPNLKPEKSRSFETGLRGNLDAGSFDVAVFHNTYRDFITEDALTPGYDQNKFQSANIKRATIKGVELKGRLELDALGAPHGLYTQGSLAYARGRNDETGQPLNSVNPLTGVLGLGFDQQGFGGLLSWTLVRSKNRVDDSAFKAPDGGSSQFKTPGFGIIDLTGYYKITQDLTLNAGLYNLTDKKYWRWDDVRGYDGTGEFAATAPANLDRLTQPGRNFGVNLIWDI
jgi:hemoglobin/transferrin/lactoferrin receptor protein